MSRQLRSMNGVLTLNPNAGSMTDALLDELRALAEEHDLETFMAEGADALEARVVQAVGEGCPLVVAGGGDGTVHAVASVLLTEATRQSAACPTLGVVPLGTGNDLARTLGLALVPTEALTQVLSGDTRALDVLAVDVGETRRYAVNVAAGGFAGLVDEQLDPDTKRRLGPLAYLTAGVAAVRELEGHDVSFEIDDLRITERVVNIVVANARTCGGGVLVAPAADPEDGLLDLVLVTEGSLLELAEVAASLRLGRVLSSSRVIHAVGRSVTLTGADGVLFNLDGELLDESPSRFTVCPRALPVRVGPGYKRERWTLPPD